MDQSHKEQLSSVFVKGLEVVNGRLVTRQFLKNNPVTGNVCLVAVGKAAAAMTLGAVDVLGSQVRSGLIITKYNHCLWDERKFVFPVRVIESGHPVPDENSLAAGKALIETVSQVPGGETLLTLVSGGASSLVEVLPPKVALSDLKRLNEWMLSAGLDITEMNKIRQQCSCIKGGKILKLNDRVAVVNVIMSDVLGNDPSVVGSGLFSETEVRCGFNENKQIPEWVRELCRVSDESCFAQLNSREIPLSEECCGVKSSHVIATCEQLRSELSEEAKKLGYPVFSHASFIGGNVEDAAIFLNEFMVSALPGLHIWNSETTVVLPNNPGSGGRCSHLALLLAQKMVTQPGITVLVGASDGTDGNTQMAGAIVDSHMVRRFVTLQLNIQKALDSFDSGSFFALSGGAINTGPTGTNLMDVIILLKE